MNKQTVWVVMAKIQDKWYAQDVYDTKGRASNCVKYRKLAPYRDRFPAKYKIIKVGVAV